MKLRGEEIKVEKGKRLCRKGKEADSVFFIKEGKFDVIVKGRKVATLGEGEIIGEIGVLLGKKRTADVIARTKSKVVKIDAGNFRRMMTVPLAFKIMESMARRIDRLNRML